MPRINVAKVISNSQFKDNFIVYRKSGSWVKGRFIEEENPIPFKGSTQPGGTKDINQVPEGDRTSEIRVFLSKEQIYVTHRNESSEGTSDVIEWNNTKYRVYQVKDWSNYGYYRAICTSMDGD